MSKLTSLNSWPELNKPHLRLDDVLPVINSFAANPKLDIHVLGYSFLNNPIHSITLGQGDIKVLAWTQMHGDEATATAAVMDVLSALLADQCAVDLDTFCKVFTFKVIPILNPDGAEARTRINAQGIDINRDAVVMQTPEGRLLRNLVDSFKPDVALNLHDQSPYYTVGTTEKPATIAFLAPAFDQQKSVNATRKRAMQLIAGMHEAINPHITGQIARYNDDYSFRSFGDTIAGLGASTILIESGAQADDPNRQIARQMNVISILRCFELMHQQGFQAFTQEHYFSIPENIENGIGDILLRQVTLCAETPKRQFKADIMLRRQKNHNRHGYIDAIGDLSHLHGFEEIDASEYSIAEGKSFSLVERLVLSEDHYRDLLRQGYTHFDGEPEQVENQSNLPILLLGKAEKHLIMPDCRSYLLLYHQQTPRLAILDNKIVEL